jgi:hypothetical protein
LDQSNGGQAAGHLSAEARLDEFRAGEHLLGFGSQARQEIIYEGWGKDVTRWPLRHRKTSLREIGARANNGPRGFAHLLDGLGH